MGYYHDAGFSRNPKKKATKKKATKKKATKKKSDLVYKGPKWRLGVADKSHPEIGVPLLIDGELFDLQRWDYLEGILDEEEKRSRAAAKSAGRKVPAKLSQQDREAVLKFAYKLTFGTKKAAKKKATKKKATKKKATKKKAGGAGVIGRKPGPDYGVYCKECEEFVGDDYGDYCAEHPGEWNLKWKR